MQRSARMKVLQKLNQQRQNDFAKGDTMADTPASQHETASHLSTEEVRAGSTPHMTRHVLAWGLGLVIVAFVAVLASYMLRT